MPQLAPKRDCRGCHKPIGRRWKDGELCRACIRQLEETGKLPKEKRQADQIPY